MNVKTLIQRHPVSAYFGLAFVVSWAGSLAAVGPRFLRGEAMQGTDWMVIALLMLAGPSLAGIALTYLVDGRPGLQDLFARMRRWRVAGRWYAALLIFPALIVAVLLALFALASPDFAPVFFLPGILVGLLAGFFEEIGWTGFAFPRMRMKRSALQASIYLGLIHALWHLLADYLGASGARGIYWLPHFVMFFGFVAALRVVIAWVYTNTESVLLAQLMHASSTGFLAILVPLSLSPANDTLFYGIYGATLWVAVAVVAATYGKHLAQPRSTQLTAA